MDGLRARADAIMVGGRTLIDEDPSLTVRSRELIRRRQRDGRPPQPARVAVVSALPDPRTGAELPADSRFLRAQSARVVVFTTSRTTDAARERLAAAGAEVVVLGSWRVDLTAALGHLARTGIEQLLVEGGGTLVAALLRERLLDEIQLYVAPILLGGRDAPTPIDGLGTPIEEAVQLRLAHAGRLGDGGVVLRYLVDLPALAREDRAPSASSETGSGVR